MAEGTGQRAFKKCPALGSLDLREGVSSVKYRIAKQEICCAVELLSSLFSGDLDTGPAWSGEERGVGVLIDLDVLDGGGRNARSVGLHAVYNEGHTVGAGCVIAEKTGEGADVVHVED